MKTVPAAVRSSPGGRRPKVNFAKLDSWWSQVVPMPSYTIPECIPAQIHAKGAAWVAFHRCENAVKTLIRPISERTPPSAPMGRRRPEMNTTSMPFLNLLCDYRLLAAKHL